MKSAKSQSSQQTTLTSFFKTKQLNNIPDVNQCSQKSIDSGHASDLSQETFYDLFNKIPGKDTKSKLGSKNKVKPKSSNRSPVKKILSKCIKSPTKTHKSNVIDSPKKCISSSIINLLSPSKKQLITDENSLKENRDKNPDFLNAWDQSKEIYSTNESHGEETVPRRSPRKHPSSSPNLNKIKCTSPLKKSSNENIKNALIDETDDALFTNLISPVKNPKETTGIKRFRDHLEEYPQVSLKRKRSLNFSPNKLASKKDKNSANDSALQGTLDSSHQNVIDLSVGCRCRVSEVKSTDQGDILITLNCLRTNAFTFCTLQYPWNQLPVSVGDLVSVKASKCSESQNEWFVPDKGGFWFVLHSDMLVSCTAVVGSLFCKRRSVLSHFFKEKPSGSQSTAMNVGIIIHQLLQQALKQKIENEEEIKKLYNSIITSQELVRTAFLLNMNLDKIKETTLDYLPKIFQFINDYVSSNTKPIDTSSHCWPGKITEIRDIEENVWIPQFGLKGKIDATVEVKINSQRKIMPLELKTGKPSNSAEHRGQVILYCMMLSQLGNDTVDSGLLLYLRDYVMKEVKGRGVERRDLIMLRNELASRLHDAYASSQQQGFFSLPEPIDRKSVCLSCCQLIPCTALLRKSGDKSHPLSELVPDKTSHLSDEHIDYIVSWLRLISLEVKQSKQFSPIWANSISIREEEGSCLGDLKIVGNVISNQFKIEITFTRDKPLKEGVLEEGQYVIVSSDNQVAIACGHVRSISPSHITLLLDRDLNKFPPPFHIDRYEADASSNMMTSFLALLLDDSPKAATLRKFIIDLELPKFVGKLKAKIKVMCHEVFNNINRDQVRALLQVLSADSFIIIKGMPGTGKSKTVGALIEVLTLLGHSVLLTSHTHSAVDNILLKLPQHLHDKILRLGNVKRVHSGIAHLTETNLLANQPIMSLDQITEFYNSKSIVGVTCLGALHQLLTRRTFDYCIVDEATQVCQPEAIAALSASKKFVLIGDPNQLPPLVTSEDAKKLGMGVSLLERLDRPAVTTSLTIQYRMNQTITSLANSFTYNDLLKCANDDIASSTIKTLKTPNDATPDWLKKVCSSELADSVIVIDISVSNQVNHNVNEAEGKIVHTAVSTLKQIGIQDANIGVISPYRAQVAFINSLLQSSSHQVEVSTVDQYQGRDKSIIFYSATRNKSMVEGSSDILGDKNRLTVAITRAKHKLVIVGNVKTLSSYPTFLSIFSKIKRTHIVKINSEDIS